MNWLEKIVANAQNKSAVPFKLFVSVTETGSVTVWTDPPAVFKAEADGSSGHHYIVWAATEGLQSRNGSARVTALLVGRGQVAEVVPPDYLTAREQERAANARVDSALMAVGQEEAKIASQAVACLRTKGQSFLDGNALMAADARLVEARVEARRLAELVTKLRPQICKPEGQSWEIAAISPEEIKRRVDDKEAQALNDLRTDCLSGVEEALEDFGISVDSPKLDRTVAAEALEEVAKKLRAGAKDLAEPRKDKTT